MSALRRSLRALLPLVVLVLGLVVPAGRVSAHNSLVSSDPADGSSVAVAPTQLSFVFANPVPLDTLTLEYIDATGVRSDLTQFTHGPSGDTEVVAALPTLGSGEISIRWRLVGADGHPITGRVGFTIAAAAAPSTTVASVTVATTVVGAVSTTIAALPTTTPPATTSTVVAPLGSDSGIDGQADGFGEPWVVPDATRWIFRMVSYLAIMMIAGIVATSVFVWAGAWGQPVLRRLTAWAVGAVVALAVVQLLVIASDISARAPWASLGSLSGALDTDAGLAFAARAGLAIVLGAVLFGAGRRRWALAGGCIIALLATWAFAGHARSMRWSVIGVPLDVAHHVAAAAWIGGLAIVGLVAMRRSGTEEIVDSVQRFARLARTAVAVIVVTGILQSLRLVGAPGRLFASDHGRYLVMKMVVLGVMLWVADLNRRRVNQKFRRPATATAVATFDLRRAMGIEMFVGIAVIGVTAMMVVSPPAVANDSMASSPAVSEAVVGDPTDPSATSPACAITATLAQGTTSEQVGCLQRLLIARGYYTGTVSGQFDTTTDAAVRAFQTGAGLAVDGVVGPTTASALGAATG